MRFWDQSFVCGGMCKGCDLGSLGCWVLCLFEVWFECMGVGCGGDKVWGVVILGMMLLYAERWSTVQVHFKATPGVASSRLSIEVTLWVAMPSCDTDEVLISGRPRWATSLSHWCADQGSSFRSEIDIIPYTGILLSFCRLFLNIFKEFDRTVNVFKPFYAFRTLAVIKLFLTPGWWWIWYL